MEQKQRKRGWSEGGELREDRAPASAGTCAGLRRVRGRELLASE